MHKKCTILECVDSAKVLCLAALAASALVAADADPVEKWGRFEVSVVNTTPYADPYRDVSLDVTYRSPSGRRVQFWGFHDGSKLWKLRFMPDEVGRWNYQARFDDGSGGAAGAFECVDSDLPGMLSVFHENPIWFGFRGGGPVLIRSLHVGDRFFAENWPAAKRAAFLDWAVSQGYNMLSIASHYLNRDSAGRGKGWDTPDLWPLRAAQYRKMEAILDELARRRVMVFPFAGFFGKSSDFPRSPADQELYVRYTLARIGPYWNILLSVAGPEPLLRRDPYLGPDEVARLGKLIARLDPFGHPLSVHNRTGDNPFIEEGWQSYSVLQGPKTTDLDVLSAGLLRNHHPAKPLLAQETLWPGNRGFGHPAYTDDAIRKNMYVILTSGTTLNFADMDGSSSSGFSGSMDLPDRHQRWHEIARQAWDLFETIPFHRMLPRQDLVDRGYCLAREGERYLVYLPGGGGVAVTRPTGRYMLEWINPRDPSDRRRSGIGDSDDRFHAPDGGDWLLRLRRLPL